MLTIKVPGTICYADILAALHVSEIAGIDDMLAGDEVEFDDVSVYTEATIDELDRNKLLPTAESPEVNVRDLRDAFTHLRKGETDIARILFESVFSDIGCDAVALTIEQIMRDWSGAEIHG